MGLQSVGLSRFRKQLNKYPEQKYEPITERSPAEKIYHYIPTQPPPKKEVFTAIREAAHKLVSILEDRGIDAEDIIRDFQRERRRKDSS